MKYENKDPFLLIISGPTASGKTDLSLQIAENVPAEIINADVGQFYEPLSVGTAKPDWQSQEVNHHLFDILDEPKDLSVVKYRELVLQKANEIWQNDKLPILVGGSLFYLKSLYFPPKDFQKEQEGKEERKVLLTKIADTQRTWWDVLNKIDSIRAKELHPNDEYRIKRALQIWQKTGVLPCEYKPEFSPKFNSLFVFINFEREILYQRINTRTVEMMKEGWIEEAQELIDTEWEKFLHAKGLIGYSEIFEWIKEGEKAEDIPLLIEIIQQQTRQYAKRQITFWNGLKILLQKNKDKTKFSCNTLEISNLEKSIFLQIKKHLDLFFGENFSCR
jgi:tRNA dimethylallyltransferase